MQNFDELAEGYLGLVEKQKVSEGKAADGSIVNGWLASQTDMLSEDWVLVDPNE